MGVLLYIFFSIYCRYYFVLFCFLSSIYKEVGFLFNNAMAVCFGSNRKSGDNGGAAVLMLVNLIAWKWLLLVDKEQKVNKYLLQSVDGG